MAVGETAMRDLLFTVKLANCSYLINTLVPSTEALIVQNVTVTYENVSEQTAELNRERKPDQDV